MSSKNPNDFLNKIRNLGLRKKQNISIDKNVFDVEHRGANHLSAKHNWCETSQRETYLDAKHSVPVEADTIKGLAGIEGFGDFCKNVHMSFLTSFV